MKTILHLPFGVEDKTATMVSSEFFTLETGCSIGSTQTDIDIGDGTLLAFKVKDLKESDGKGERHVYPESDSVVVSIPGHRDILINDPSHSSLKAFVIQELFKANWTNPDGNLEYLRNPMKKCRDDGVVHPESDFAPHSRQCCPE